MFGFAVSGWVGWTKGGEERGECTDHYEPFRLLDAVRVWLWISQRFPFGVFGRFDFVGGAVADEDGLAAPFDDDLFPQGKAISTMELQAITVGKNGGAYVLALGYGSQVNLNLCLRQHVCGGGHVD